MKILSRSAHTGALCVGSMLALSAVTLVNGQQAVPAPVTIDLHRTDQQPRTRLVTQSTRDTRPRYTVKRQDQLVLSFPLSPELNQTLTVQPDGFVNLSGVPGVHVEGLTVPEATEVLKTAYSAILNDPILTVDLRDFQKPFYTVSGQVGKPGKYELRSDINVAEAIAEAGGLAPTAKDQIFVFHRASAEYYSVQKVDYKRLLKGKNLDDAAVIQPGDMILVPESGITTFRKYVPYSIGASYFPTN